MRALERENERLAGEARTLLGELRTLEAERDRTREEADRAEAAAAAATAAVEAIGQRIGELDQARLAQLPDVRAHLVDLYKRGRRGYVPLLAGARDVRELARLTRAVAAMAAIARRRMADHRRTLDALRAERAALEAEAGRLAALEAEARQARAAAARAVAARSALIARIDARRDLTAQYVGELRAAYARLQQQVADLAAGRPADSVQVPLAPFRGVLDWPAPGAVSARFGQSSGRLGGTAVRNGIEIAAPEGAPVRAVHDGTVGFAGPFTGFGTLVILEHGGENFSLYGYLAAAEVERGQRVDAGAVLGRVGQAPAGPAALFFELRVDGLSTDPVQWLKPR